MIEEDIARGVSYVVDRDGVIEAVFSYIEGEDPTYRQIEQGMWRTNGSYGTVHRLASAGRLRGVAGICFPGVPSRQNYTDAAVFGPTRIRTTALCSIFCKKTDLCTAE